MSKPVNDDIRFILAGGPRVPQPEDPDAWRAICDSYERNEAWYDEHVDEVWADRSEAWVVIYDEACLMAADDLNGLFRWLSDQEPLRRIGAYGPVTRPGQDRALIL